MRTTAAQVAAVAAIEAAAQAQAARSAAAAEARRAEAERAAHRRWYAVHEYAEATGLSPWVVRWQLRTGRLRGRDLNAGTGKRPRWQVRAADLAATEGGAS